MRLIDADKLRLPPEDIGSRMAVAYAPTAYDVDKVVEELESAEYPYYLNDEDGYRIDESLLMSGMVEDIVRRGGVDENIRNNRI